MRVMWVGIRAHCREDGDVMNTGFWSGQMRIRDKKHDTQAFGGR